MKGLIRNDIQFFLRQPLFWLTLLLMPGFAFLLAIGTGSVSDIPLKQMQMISMGLLMMALPLSFAFLSPVLYLRDKTSGMQELISVTPVQKYQRLLARWSTLVLTHLFLLILCDLIFAVHANMQQGFEQSIVNFAAFNVLLLGMPAVVFLASLSLWVSEKFGSALVNYVVFILFWLGYVILASMTGSPILAGSTHVSTGLMNAMQLFDPYGISALMSSIQQTGHVELWSLSLVLNRVGYLLLSLVIFIFSLYAKPLQFNIRTLLKNKSTALKEGIDDAHNISDTFYEKSITHPQYSFLATLRQLIITDLKGLLSNKLNILLLVGWPMLVFQEVLSGIGHAESFSVLTPNSIDAINRIAWDLIPIAGSLFAALFSWQLCWRNKQHDIAELVSVAPVGSGVFSLSHLVNLILALSLLIVLAAIGALAAEFVAGSQVMPMHYVKQFSFNWVSAIILAATFVAIHTFSHQRMVAGLLVMSVLIIKYSPLTALLGFSHPLWDIFTIPLSTPDSFWGFTGASTTLLPYGLFWTLFSFVLVLFAIEYSHRGSGIRTVYWRLIHVKAKLWQFGAVGLCIFALVLHQKMLDEQPLLTSVQNRDWRVQYEQKYSHWSDTPQPSVESIDSAVDIYPEQGIASFTLDYTLVNKTDSPIHEVLVGGWGNIAFKGVALEQATLQSFDKTLNQTIFKTASAMMPNDALTLTVHFDYKQPSLLEVDMHQIVKPSFTYLRSVPVLPHVGFNSNARIRNTEIREEYGLSPILNDLPSERFANRDVREGSYDFVHFRSIVSTSADQHALTQGELKREWLEDDRRYFEYETNQPMRNIPVWMSVPFQPVKDEVDGIKLNIFAPEAEKVADLHLLAMQDTIHWFNQHIYPYPGKQLNIVAFPNIGPTGYALPQVILINNRVGFRATPSADAGFDQRYRRAVHETAHQWFGHTLGNGVEYDRSFLIESMAKYIELVMIEQRYGQAAVDSLVAYEDGRYRIAQARSSRPTQALVDAEASHDAYSRSTIVFTRLRETMGDEPIIDALKQLFVDHAFPNPPATSMDFVRALKQQSEGIHHKLIEDLLINDDIAMLLE